MGVPTGGLHKFYHITIGVTMADDKYKRANFMTETQRKQLGNMPRSHENCIEKTGVARPGKTAQDRARRQR